MDDGKFNFNGSNGTTPPPSQHHGQDDLPVGLTAFYCIIMGGIVLSAIFGNSLVITAVRRTRSLRTSSAILVVNLACVDLAVTILIVPFVIVIASTHGWSEALPGQLCKATGFMNAFLTAAQIMALLHISINRFIAVAFPHSYEKLTIKRVTVIEVLSGWVYSLLWTLMPFFGWGELGFIKGTLFCNILWSHELSYALTVQMVCYILPTAVAVVLYIAIYVYVRKQSKRAKKRSRSTLSLGDVTAVTQSNGTDNQGATGSTVNVSRNDTAVAKPTESTKKDANAVRAEKARSKRRKVLENRVTRTLLGVALAFAVCWFPRGVANLWALFEGREKVPMGLEYVSTAFVFMNSSVNPIIYGALHQDFNRAFREILSCKRNKRNSRSDLEFSASVSGPRP